MRKCIIALGAVLGALAALALGYAIYVLEGQYRVPDMQALPVSQAAEGALEVGSAYTLVTWNLGFGAYSDDFSFFMDGGERARAFSREAVEQNTDAMIARMRALSPDMLVLQEVDLDADRSWHVDQRERIEAAFPDMSACFALNYDSPYLFYPLYEPIGRSRSGILTLSAARMESGVRRSLPLEAGLSRLTDLDRCYSVCYFPLANGRTLCLYNLHLSAYTSDGSISTQQAQLLLSDMAAQYALGNYALAGGDFNKDLVGDAASALGEGGAQYAWASAFPFELLPEGVELYAPRNAHTCRCADAPYDPDTAFTVTLDGFLATQNIEVLQCETVDEGFAHSDHNPVLLRFRLAA